MAQPIQPPAVDLQELRRAIQHEYARVAEQPEHGFHFLVGRPLSQRLDYENDWLSGIDSLISARMVGESGRVIGVDMTPAMLARARASADAKADIALCTG